MGGAYFDAVKVANAIESSWNTSRVTPGSHWPYGSLLKPQYRVWSAPPWHVILSCSWSINHFTAEVPKQNQEHSESDHRWW